jgi:hypothetical protein
MDDVELATERAITGCDPLLVRWQSAIQKCQPLAPIEALNLTHFGTSGRYIESSMKHQPALTPGGFGAMSKLRTVLYTGSPLGSGYRWIMRH